MIAEGSPDQRFSRSIREWHSCWNGDDLILQIYVDVFGTVQVIAWGGNVPYLSKEDFHENTFPFFDRWEQYNIIFPENSTAIQLLRDREFAVQKITRKFKLEGGLEIFL